MEIAHLWATCSTAGPLSGGTRCFVLSFPSLQPILLVLLPCPTEESGSVISLQALGAALRSQGSCSYSRLLKPNSLTSPHSVLHLLQWSEEKRQFPQRVSVYSWNSILKSKVATRSVWRKKKTRPLIKTKPPNPNSLQVLRMQLKSLLSATICHVH